MRQVQPDLPNDMARFYFLPLLSFVVLVVLCTSAVSGNHNSLRQPNSYIGANLNTLTREKRQLESFENDEYGPKANQGSEEEPSFWDKIVRAALKLVNKFMEWLNS